MMHIGDLMWMIENLVVTIMSSLDLISSHGVVRNKML